MKEREKRQINQIKEEKLCTFMPTNTRVMIEDTTKTQIIK
jgi:hypothetical protein